MTLWLALLLVLPPAGVAPGAAPGGGAMDPPAWQAPPPGAFPQAMAVTGVVRVAGVELRSSSDRVAAFVGGEIRAVAAPTLIGNRRVFFVSVAGGPGDGAVSFRAYDALRDRVVDLLPAVPFDPDAPVGTAATPLVWTPATGEPPVWTVNPADFEGSMSLTASVREGPDEVVEPGTRVAAFVGDELRGAGPIQTAGAAGWRAFLTVYGTPEESATLTFQVYRPGLGAVRPLSGRAALAVGSSAGTIALPVVLTLPVGATLTGTDGWRMLAPSGVDATAAALLAPIWTQGFPGADVPFGAPNVYRFVEATGAYAAPTDGEAWARGSGRFVYVYADDDPRTPVVDSGFPKTLPSLGVGPAGPFAFPLTRTEGTGQPDGPGWNLLGNPFDVAMDWDVGWTRADVSGSLYVWDPGYLGGAYRVWNGTVGSLAGGVVPAGNAFWAQATGPAPVLTASEAARAPFAPVLGRDAALGVRLHLASDARPGQGAEAFVSFQPEASAGLDALDAHVLAPLVAAYVALGVRTDGSLLAIDARPAAPAALALDVAAVGAPAGPLETLRLTWPGLDLPPGLRASLRDTETGAVTDLHLADGYTFTLDVPDGAAPPRATGLPPVLARGPAAARFVLSVEAAQTTATAGEAARALALDAPQPNPARASSEISFSLAEAGAVRLSVVDLLGREVAVLLDGPCRAGRHTERLATRSLAPGVYVVRLVAGREARTQRLAVAR